MPITVIVPEVELFDSKENQFTMAPEVVLEMEHSLISLSKWEARFKKPFLGDAKKTVEETYGYMQAMCLNPNVPLSVIMRIPTEDHQRINEYIEDSMTATWFNEDPRQAGRRGEIVTAELIYHWIYALNIDMEWENRHLSRLFTLIKTISLKNNPPKKQRVSKAEMAAQRRELNNARRAQAQSAG